MKFLLLSLVFLFAGCAAAKRVGIDLLYREVQFPESQVIRDLPYVPNSTSPRQALDLFRAPGTNWPVLIFVHGGGWNAGNKGSRVGGADVYGNIGRFFASRGIGVAVINYRLLPEVSWREQAADVASAVAWVHDHLGAYGGDKNRVFIGGHSAGAHLASMVALNPKFLVEHGLSPSNLSGVISVSGAALDLADARTYELGEKLPYYEQRFAEVRGSGDWKESASPVVYASDEAPPFLILYAEGEKKSMHRQSQRLQEALRDHGVRNRIVAVPGQSHTRIVLTLSRPDRTAGPAILEFIRGPK